MKLELEVKLKLELINVKQNMFISTYIEVIYSFLQRTLLKNVGIRTFSGSYFTVMGLNTEIYRVNPRIQSKCGIIRTKKLQVWTLFAQYNLYFGIHTEISK